ncbi:MAG: sarcosine oxidase subunit gamma family protein [Burkholderiaceae bacterium]
MPEVLAISPLAHLLREGSKQLQADGRACTLVETAPMDMWSLRGNATDVGFAQVVLQHTAMHLPLRPNSASIDPQRQLLWMGPDEWLLKVQPGQGEVVAANLRQALQGSHSALVEVGHGNSTLVVQGPGAADLISRGCPLDLHPRTFPTGSLAQSHIAKANVTLLCLQAGSHFEITVRRSFADYLFHWLCKAGE